MHGGGLHSLRPEKGGPHRALRGIDIVFQQSGRQIQRVADIVETVGRRVRREIVRGPNVDAEQIADGVVVLGAIEPVRRDTSGLRLDRAILPGEFGLQPARDRRNAFGCPAAAGRAAASARA